MIAGYAEDEDGRLLPIVVDRFAPCVQVVTSHFFARRFGIAFGDTFVVGTLAHLGAQAAWNIAEAYRPEAVG